MEGGCYQGPVRGDEACGAKFETQSSERLCVQGCVTESCGCELHKRACVARTRSTDLLFPTGCPLRVSAVCFGPNSSLLAPEGADRLILLWNVVGGGVAAHRQAQSFLSGPHPPAYSFVGKVLGFFVSPHPVSLVGSGQMTPWQEFWAQCS